MHDRLAQHDPLPEARPRDARCGRAVATIMRVLRLRHALVRASRRRSLGLVVLVCAALLLTVLAFHTAEHGVEEGAVLTTCFAVVLVAAGVSRSAAKAPSVHIRFDPPRFLPVRSRGVVALAATESPPGFIPLRL